jgi:hypothetical protein
MSQLKIFFTISLIILALCPTLGLAQTVTNCFKNTCAIITAPDHVAPGEEYEVQVEGYIENATSWDTSAYMLLENAGWQYDESHFVRYTGKTLDIKGFNWGGNFLKKYKFSDLPETKVFTFVFGSRGSQHGYYDVAVDVTVEIASSVVDVAFDIKPQSCPNPLNVNKKGVLSAAIIGSIDFDVTQVDPATIQILGVSPIHSSYEDVTEPFYPLSGKVSELECTDAGPDGYLDLTLKFRAQDIYAALQKLNDQPLKKGDNITLKMTAELSSGNKDEPKTSISGEDVIRINSKN